MHLVHSFSCNPSQRALIPMSFESPFNCASLESIPPRRGADSTMEVSGSNGGVPSGSHTILRSHSSAEQAPFRLEARAEAEHSGRDATWVMRYRHGSRGLTTAIGQLPEQQEKRKKQTLQMNWRIWGDTLVTLVECRWYLWSSQWTQGTQWM